ncbi:MAG: hypothetical protein GY719_04915 [bacterium]|nr:hypothetical protein [bacterium]
MTSQITSVLAQEIVELAATDSWATATVRPLSPVGDELQNELLFFFKPEAFLAHLDDTKIKILTLVFDKFSEFSAKIAGVFLITGKHLAKTNTIARHYGYINKLSASASRLVSADERATMFGSLELESDPEPPVLGGHEALSRFDHLDPESLDKLWASKHSHKLRGGFYYQTFKIRGERTILVNAFHPLQLAHYTAPGQRVCAVLLRSDTNWGALRREMVGDTFPRRAATSSIRGALAARAQPLGLGEVSVAFNYCHLSAGPFEALFEINNFLGSDQVAGFDPSTSAVGRRLAEGNPGGDPLGHAMSNPVAELGAKTSDLFSTTEDMDTDSACQLYLENFLQPHL